jgi:hypothetical protein
MKRMSYVVCRMSTYKRRDTRGHPARRGPRYDMQNTRIAKVLSIIVIISGMVVMIGWIFDIGLLKSIHPAWVSMKLITSLTFVLSGIVLYFITRVVEGEFDTAQVVISIASLTIILLMGLLFFSALLNVHTGIEDLFIEDLHDAVMSVVPGRPSFPTMFNFMLIGAAGIITILNPDKAKLTLKIIGSIIAAIGVIAILGYCIGIPLLYYYIEGINSSIAFHTAVLFVLLGIGLLCL